MSSEQATIDALQANWVWLRGWEDAPDAGSDAATTTTTAGRIVRFTRSFDLATAPASPVLLHCSADTRYKLLVNGTRVAVGPARSSPWLWYYDSVDLAPYLVRGRNVVECLVLRYFATVRGAMPFARTPVPGFTAVGAIDAEGGGRVDLCSGASASGWVAQVDASVCFPMGLIDDGFLHISERVSPTPPPQPPVAPVNYNIRTVNGELSPWRLRPRAIPMPEASAVGMSTVRNCESVFPADAWAACLSGAAPLTLDAGSEHTLDVLADVHSTAFLRWTFRAVGDGDDAATHVYLKAMYSEGYEEEPRSYPFFRTKNDRLDAEHGHIIGPFDEVTLAVPSGEAVVVYEPYWFRTLRVMRLRIANAGRAPVQLLSLSATQVNYPMATKARWHAPRLPHSAAMWDVSIRTLRNCMFDGYSDCPFYEQLQYSGDSRSVGLFHYLLSGDDRLMRQAITNFAASVLSEGLTQSRFPSHVPQLIAGFPLYWVLMVSDHHLHFGDRAFARSFLPRIDGVLDFFDQHVDARGLVSGLPADVWQYVDWTTTWGATDEHPDKGVPTAGRAANCHTFFSLLYAYVLREAAALARGVGRPGHASEYEARAAAVTDAVRRHCYDGRYFVDTTADVLSQLPPGAPTAYSQHCQVFAVLAGACDAADATRLLTESFSAPAGTFAKCSYVMQFYALRAFAMAGDDAYEAFMWPRVWQPWYNMLANNLSTWEEDDVRQRSDCHAWGSVPVHEFCTELAGVQVTDPGARAVLFKPRLRLTAHLDARVCLGKDNVAAVTWAPQDGADAADGVSLRVDLRLEHAVTVVSILPGGQRTSHGETTHVSLTWRD